MSEMKRFESCLYTPLGFSRELDPISNADLQNLSINFLNKTSKIKFATSNIEVYSEEVSKAGF